MSLHGCLPVPIAWSAAAVGGHAGGALNVSRVRRARVLRRLRGDVAVALGHWLLILWLVRSTQWYTCRICEWYIPA